MPFTSERVLSIQSHVVFGYVGGKAAVFPLQCLGYDVDVVNTVNFSNHAGYGRTGGSKTTAAELNSTFESMEHNELLMPTRLLTGYVPGAEALSAIQKLAENLKHTKPNLIYLLDPVMGDSGHIYVAPDVIPVYRMMLPLATIITPNWFEVELLTDTKLEDLSSLQRALKILHDQYHVPNVVITSIPIKPWIIAALPTSIRPFSPDTSSRSSTSSSTFPSRSTSPFSSVFIEPERETVTDSHLLCISSTVDPISHTSTFSSTVHAQIVPLFPGYFSGVGDLFSALLLAHYNPSTSTSPSSISTPLSHAASLALTKTHRLLLLTYSNALSLPEEERLPSDDELDRETPLRKTRRMRGRELALIKGQGIIRGEEEGERRDMIPWDGFWELNVRA